MLYEKYIIIIENIWGTDMGFIFFNKYNNINSNMVYNIKKKEKIYMIIMAKKILITKTEKTKTTINKMMD